MINAEPFYAWPFKPVNTVLEGQGWFSPGATQIPQGYYQPILTQEGWTGQLSVASETLYGLDAGGYHGVAVGFIKVQDGYFRAMEMDQLTGVPEPTNVNIFVSDIVPLSQVIPGYMPACPSVNVENSNSQADAPYPPIQGEYHVNLPNQLMLVDSQGRRTGEDPASGIVYREIPNTNYGDVGSDGELFTSNLPSGQYALYVLGGQTGSYWIDGEHDGQPGQIFRGAIQKGSMIAYVQNYNTADIASSTFSVSSTFPSTASLTTAPPNNWTPPAL